MITAITSERAKPSMSTSQITASSSTASTTRAGSRSSNITDARATQRTSRSEREIPWALIGPATAARAQIASQLVEHLSPLGFVFLAEGGPTLSPRAIRDVLSHTELYIWSPENGESLARRQAL